MGGISWMREAKYRMNWCAIGECQLCLRPAASCDRLILSMKLRDHREYNSTLNVIHFIAYHHVVTLALLLLRDLGIFATLNCEANPLCKEIPTLTTPFN